MKETVVVTLLDADDWKRLRDLRLRSLKENPEAFGGLFEIEELIAEDGWRAKFEAVDYLAASIDGFDVGLMSVEVLEGDHGATCWVGGCWTDSNYRGRGVLRAMISYVDSHALEHGWQRQGLGVWADNLTAIAAYESLGFSKTGPMKPSDRHPGKFYLHMIRDAQ
ncbi:MAG: GNAT family N-acetyltransferase [Actinobacteria bacterium]|uniref:Unannotated protein n=1 Tax=freshwater metagenome TaxID=449393 RepID=A0A6J7ABQ3_9ZZZZ|nr:GNAT family N-acetyltransferase [Actinomycetota bacterium]MSX62625.1 GNAT family N-acetyltransferase [Actinomycetota bacterium]MSZ69255.1 GNAT family N-acetyltransferase [Actinomycetota bacterium]MTA67953.1 GNAT family N-acetyltransferase [Actinomycetota bacterium]MTB15647.1 GNAT family N-acetyltransferase [Actinomycetota bacterium]